ncbi:MAG: NADH-quinone oxidoreductase subunit J [Clostridia bacterium]|jgi:NADH:ubiquinone oxidoreductase subunit 6 (subunit J)|nr:NADH-quinone oxidoreductase subunit J [Clostridia bacterium]
MELSSLAFWILATMIIISGLGVVFLKNIVHSALALIATFIGAAGIYLTLHSEFLAAIQVLIYAGAIAILIVFGIMLITKGEGKMGETNLFGKYKISAGIVVLIMVSLVSYLVLQTPWQITTELNESLMSDIAKLIFYDHVVAFELAGVLLTVAMIGAIMIARGVKKNG